MGGFLFIVNYFENGNNLVLFKMVFVRKFMRLFDIRLRCEMIKI